MSNNSINTNTNNNSSNNNNHSNNNNNNNSNNNSNSNSNKYNKVAFDRNWWDEPDERFGFEAPEDPEVAAREKIWIKHFQKHKASVLNDWLNYDKELAERTSRSITRERSASLTDSISPRPPTSPAATSSVAHHFSDRRSSFSTMISNVTSTNVKKLFRKGVPSSRRAKEWMEKSGAVKKKNENIGEYEKYVNSAVPSQISDDIQMDIARTFSVHMMFADVNTKKMMLRLLCAYAVRNPGYGYCQNMTCIMGFILFFLPEEDAFWLFTTIMEDLLPKDFCSPTLIGLRVDQKVLEVLIRERLPKLHAHFAKFDVDISVFTTSWLLRLFVNVFPIETTLRVWDCFLFEGSKVLFRVALAFLKLHEEQVRQCTGAGELLTLLNLESKRFYDADKLIKTCASFWVLRRKQINELRDRITEEVTKADQLPPAKPI